VLGAIAGRSAPLARDLQARFSLSFKRLASIALPPRDANRAVRSRKRSRGGAPAGARGALISLVSALLERGGSESALDACGAPALLGAIVRHLSGDPPRGAQRVLAVL
jgi:hypothetical protein